MVAVSSWGRLSSPQHQLQRLVDPTRLADTLAAGGPGIAHGMGRSYGDVCLNPGGALWQTRGLDRFISFDRERGLLACESGVLLKDIQELVLTSGWMLPVTPGTQYVTVGGAIANDVHGKNHHREGSFGNQLSELGLVRTNGEVIRCGPDHRPDWFAATVGGMGLTGIITDAVLKLKPVSGPMLEIETLSFGSLEEFFALSEGSERDWEYTVAWIDCVSRSGRRGIFFRANHADQRAEGESRQRRMSVPFTPPVSLVNRLSLRPFNAAYYKLHKSRAGRALQHYQPFFYPLDSILSWNRIYGPRGFYQYQCVLPPEGGPEGVRELLDETARSNEGSFLAVLKEFGDVPSLGLLSFPRPGVTLALDFPNRGPATLALLERLDAIVGAAGGCIYGAKDARMPVALFQSGYPRLEEFLPFRDPGISSGLSRRLLGS